MPHVSVHYKVIIPAGHHRQPRNANGELEPYPSSEVDVDEPGIFRHYTSLKYNTHTMALSVWLICYSGA